VAQAFGNCWQRHAVGHQCKPWVWRREWRLAFQRLRGQDTEVEIGARASFLDDVKTARGDHRETTSALYIGYGAVLGRPTEPI
jgi:hypothetical protein